MKRLGFSLKEMRSKLMEEMISVLSVVIKIQAILGNDEDFEGEELMTNTLLNGLNMEGS